MANRTYRTFKNNGDGMYLAIYECEKCIYLHDYADAGLEIDEKNMRNDIQLFIDDASVIDCWEGNMLKETDLKTGELVIENIDEFMEQLEETDLKYYVKFGTGAGDYSSINYLESLMQEINKYLAYTQKSVSIYDSKDNEIAYLPWYDVAPEEDDVVTARFGDFGFYGEWEVY